MEKYDVSAMNDLIGRTWKIIDKDPLLSLWDEVSSIKENFEAIHKAISDEGIDENEKRGLLWKVMAKLIGKDEGFQFKSFEEKINSIFRQFDITFESVSGTIEMYTKYGEGLNKEIGSLASFLDGIDTNTLSPEDRGVYANYEAMKNTLINSLWRIEMSVKSAEKLHNIMETGRPMFQALLSSCMIEVSGQRSIDASTQMIGTLTWTIESLSNTLTESTIKSSKQAIAISTQPVLSSSHLEGTMLKLQGAFSEMKKQQEDYANKLILEQSKDANKSE